MARLSLGVSSWSFKIRECLVSHSWIAFASSEHPLSRLQKAARIRLGHVIACQQSNMAGERLRQGHVQGHVIAHPYRDRLVALSIRVMGLSCFG